MQTSFIISGRVQGVGYRAFARQAAIRIGIKGWVRNLPNGNVECLAQGSPAEIDSFEAQLKKGPAFGRVEQVIRGTGSEQTQFVDFQIIH